MQNLIIKQFYRSLLEIYYMNWQVNFKKVSNIFYFALLIILFQLVN